VLERFTEPARRAVVHAQDEARALQHGYIGTEHLLLGLLRDESGATRSLESLGVSLEALRARVVRVIGRGDEPAVGQIPFTPRGRRVLELSLSEAVARSDSDIGPEHILLALVRVDDGEAARILLDRGVDAQRIRDAVEENRTDEPD
jgi:ATP-dependent Clp protease ATP-binding subunit ClpC